MCTWNINNTILNKISILDILDSVGNMIFDLRFASGQTGGYKSSIPQLSSLIIASLCWECCFSPVVYFIECLISWGHGLYWGALSLTLSVWGFLFCLYTCWIKSIGLISSRIATFFIAMWLFLWAFVFEFCFLLDLFFNLTYFNFLKLFLLTKLCT